MHCDRPPKSLRLSAAGEGGRVRQRGQPLTAPAQERMSRLDPACAMLRFSSIELSSCPIIDDLPPPAALWTAKAPSTKLTHRYASPREYACVSCRMA
jgi:hypothetical protein